MHLRAGMRADVEERKEGGMPMMYSDIKFSDY